MGEYVDLSNKNNHAAVAKKEASDRVEALLEMINKKRLELQMKEVILTSEVLFFLRDLEKELFKGYEKELNDGELSRAREEYMLMFHKKPFLAWSVEEIRAKMEEGKAPEIVNLANKKKEWKKAMKK